MKDASGASQLDKWTEVASLHGVSMLEAARNSLETNLCLALVHEPGDENDWALINVATGASLYLHGDPMLAAAQAAREAGQAPHPLPSAPPGVLWPPPPQRAPRGVGAA